MADEVKQGLAAGEVVANMDPNGPKVFRATDPVISNFATPGDFAAQFPNPLDPTEVIALCEELGVWKAIPEERTGLKTYTWRELDSLTFTLTGTHPYLAFADGACPEEYEHAGDNLSVDLKNIGVKKTLGVSDIMHSAASIGAGYGISALLGGFPAGEGTPGGDGATFIREQIADLKEKEIRLGMTLTLNGWDEFLVNGDTDTSALEFNGIVDRVTQANGSHYSNTGASGTFTGAAFNQFLSEACAKPDTLFGHPAAMQELLSAYFALGFNGSQIVNFASGQGITPGYNFDGFVNTGIGRMRVVSDSRFPRAASGATTFQSTIYALRMMHNGAPLVYKITQIPLSLKDLVPGCTAIAFEIWAKTALVIKALCAQNAYVGMFTGRITTTCTLIG